MSARIVRNVLDLIGNTPLFEVDCFDTGHCRLFLKLESQNPGGSIKDRMAISMVEAAEREGKLQPGGTIVDATSGNTGIALAMVCLVKGYKLKLVVPDKFSNEKVAHMRALDAEIIPTRSDVVKGHPDYYSDAAERIARETPNAYFTNQFANPANPAAHEMGTGPEIWEQMGHNVDAVVCGVGTGGTITGLSRYFAKTQPQLDMVLADPVGSVVAEYIRTGKVGTAGSWATEGMGEDYIPVIADLSRVKHAYSIGDSEALGIVRELARKTGILAGTSTGVLIGAALRYCRGQKTPKRVVTFACDSGNKYLSKVFNDWWMIDNGFLERTPTGDLRDLIARRHSDRGVVWVTPDTPLTVVFHRMRMADVSQLPVLEGGKIVGIADESDLLEHVRKEPQRFKDPVSTAMSTRLEILPPTAPLSAVEEIFNHHHIVIVCDGEEFIGLITRTDILNYLRRKMG
jgi:cystathionine beta-synthase